MTSMYWGCPWCGSLAAPVPATFTPKWPTERVTLRERESYVRCPKCKRAFIHRAAED